MLDAMSVETKTALFAPNTIGDVLGKDPLGKDHPDDELRVITDRQLVRLLIVAAQAAARFERERSDVDPVAWMLSSRRLFAGEAAINACHELSCFTRAIILHGLSIGVDADLEAIDALVGASDINAKRPGPTHLPH